MLIWPQFAFNKATLVGHLKHTKEHTVSVTDQLLLLIEIHAIERYFCRYVVLRAKLLSRIDLSRLFIVNEDGANGTRQPNCKWHEFTP